MMMRPRSYGSLNRAIARSISYSLRQYGKQNKYKSNNVNTYKNTNTSNINNPEINIVTGFAVIVLITFIVALPFLFPVFWVIYFVLWMLYLMFK